MASPVDIANLALAHLGDDADVASFDPPEGSAQAEHCARFYPIARDSLLELHPWTFATTTQALALVGTAPDGWLYSYQLPNLCLKPLLVYTPGSRRYYGSAGDDCGFGVTGVRTVGNSEFEVEMLPDLSGQVILTDVPDAILRYTLTVEDTTRFSPLFVEALSWYLATMLAGPVVKGDSGVAAAKSCWAIFMNRLGEARMADANKSRVTIDPVAPWLAVR
jgi:hypothetical protein